MNAGGDDYQTRRIHHCGKAAAEILCQNGGCKSGDITECGRDDHDCNKRMKIPPLCRANDQDDRDNKDERLR